MKPSRIRKTRVEYPQWTRKAERTVEDMCLRAGSGIFLGLIVAAAAMAFPEYGALTLGTIVAWKFSRKFSQSPRSGQNQKGQPRQYGRSPEKALTR